MVIKADDGATGGMTCTTRGCLGSSEQQAQKQETPDQKNREWDEGQKR